MSRNFKVIVTAIVVTVLIWCSVLPFGAIEVVRAYGDVDNDAYVTTEDARIVLKVAAGIDDTALYGLDFEAADLDGDGEITTVDARLVLRTAAGHIETRYMEGFEFNEEPEKFADEINDYRFEQDRKAIKFTLSTALCDVAKVAAQEYVTKTGSAFIREDGTYYYKMLDDMGVEYSRADKIVIPASFGYKQAVDKIIADSQGEKAIMNDEYRNIGIGAYSADGRTFYWCVILTD